MARAARALRAGPLAALLPRPGAAVSGGALAAGTARAAAGLAAAAAENAGRPAAAVSQAADALPAAAACATSDRYGGGAGSSGRGGTGGGGFRARGWWPYLGVFAAGVAVGGTAATAAAAAATSSDARVSLAWDRAQNQAGEWDSSLSAARAASASGAPGIRVAALARWLGGPVQGTVRPLWTAWGGPSGQEPRGMDMEDLAQERLNEADRQTLRRLLPLLADAGAGLANDATSPPSDLEVPPPVGRPDVPLRRYAVAEAAAKASSAVVNLTRSVGFRAGSFSAYFGHATGSGFCLDASGLILTNAHVVGGAGAAVAGSIAGSVVPPLTVTFPDGRTFEGRVIAADGPSDLAVVKVESREPLPVVKLGRSADLRAGEWAIAVGSPLHLQNTVTAGIISCVDRKSSEIGLRGGRVGSDFIQTDATINPGNSGGPLLNLEGEVVGIANMKAAFAEGINFAIPVDTAKDVLAQLAQHGRVPRPYVGIRMLELTPEVAAQLRERGELAPAPAMAAGRGVLVAQVLPGSPAAEAGVRPGDVIVSLDGRPVQSVREMLRALDHQVGRRLELRVLRADGAAATLWVVPVEAAA